ncbi:MAG: hypothetical protein R3D71_09980 [Rickettsiales bacterium]
MHNLHFIVVNADSAEDAALAVEQQIADWGGEDNWRRIGGIASEDNNDNIENKEDGRWGLEFIRNMNIGSESNLFIKTVSYLKNCISANIKCPHLLTEKHNNLNSSLSANATLLQNFQQSDDPLILYQIYQNIRYLYQISLATKELSSSKDIPEFYSWELCNFGLTDFTTITNGKQRYIIFLDMHS